MTGSVAPYRRIRARTSLGWGRFSRSSTRDSQLPSWSTAFAASLMVIRACSRNTRRVAATRRVGTVGLALLLAIRISLSSRSSMKLTRTTRYQHIADFVCAGLRSCVRSSQRGGMITRRTWCPPSPHGCRRPSSPGCSGRRRSWLTAGRPPVSPVAGGRPPPAGGRDAPDPPLPGRPPLAPRRPAIPIRAAAAPPRHPPGRRLMDATEITAGRLIEIGVFDRILVTAARPDGDHVRVDGCKHPYRPLVDWVTDKLVDP